MRRAHSSGAAATAAVQLSAFGNSQLHGVRGEGGGGETGSLIRKLSRVLKFLSSVLVLVLCVLSQSSLRYAVQEEEELLEHNYHSSSAFCNTFEAEDVTSSSLPFALLQLVRLLFESRKICTLIAHFTCVTPRVLVPSPPVLVRLVGEVHMEALCVFQFISISYDKTLTMAKLILQLPGNARTLLLRPLRLPAPFDP